MKNKFFAQRAPKKRVNAEQLRVDKERLIEQIMATSLIQNMMRYNSLLAEEAGDPIVEFKLSGGELFQLLGITKSGQVVACQAPPRHAA